MEGADDDLGDQNFDKDDRADESKEPYSTGSICNDKSPAQP